jgi:RecA/RadA recombinase
MEACTVERCPKWGSAGCFYLSVGLKLMDGLQFVGTAGIGKSQVAMTLAVVCAMDYPGNGVMFFDAEHNFSAKRWVCACW